MISVLYLPSLAAVPRRRIQTRAERGRRAACRCGGTCPVKTNKTCRMEMRISECDSQWTRYSKQRHAIHYYCVCFKVRRKRAKKKTQYIPGSEIRHNKQRHTNIIMIRNSKRKDANTYQQVRVRHHGAVARAHCFDELDKMRRKKE
jgi:hypothetical protein